MKTRRRLALSLLAAGIATLFALPAAASATIIVTPGSLTFPERQVATESDPQVVTVQVFCTPPSGNGMGVCTTPDGFLYNPQFVGSNPGDFSATNVSCPPFFLLNNGLTQNVCQFNVRFKPTAPGTRQAVLIPGTGQSSAPNPVVLNGSAVAAPVVTPTPTPTAPAKKKCKKGFKRVKGKCRKKKR